MHSYGLDEQLIDKIEQLQPELRCVPQVFSTITRHGKSKTRGYRTSQCQSVYQPQTGIQVGVARVAVSLHSYIAVSVITPRFARRRGRIQNVDDATVSQDVLISFGGRYTSVGLIAHSTMFRNDAA